MLVFRKKKDNSFVQQTKTWCDMDDALQQLDQVKTAITREFQALKLQVEQEQELLSKEQHARDAEKQHLLQQQQSFVTIL